MAPVVTEPGSYMEPSSRCQVHCMQDGVDCWFSSLDSLADAKMMFGWLHSDLFCTLSLHHVCARHHGSLAHEIRSFFMHLQSQARRASCIVRSQALALVQASNHAQVIWRACLAGTSQPIAPQPSYDSNTVMGSKIHRQVVSDLLVNLVRVAPRSSLYKRVRT